MAYPKELRDRFGISQEAFAILLNCNRSHLNMAERGERLLPAGNVSLTLALLQQASTGETITATKPPATFLKRRQATLQAALNILQRDQELLTEKTAQTARLLKAGTALGKAPFADDTANLQWDVLLRKASTRPEKELLKAVKIKLSIAAKTAEINEISNMLAAE